MKRTVTLVLALFIAVAGFAWSAAPRSEAAAQTLFAMQRCSTTSPGTLDIQFSWTGNNPGASQQTFDISLQNNAWVPGTFTTFGPIAATTTAFVAPGLASNTIYYVRVNQLVNGVWDSSITWQVTTMNCTQFVSTAPTTVTFFQQPVTTFVVVRTFPIFVNDPRVIHHDDHDHDNHDHGHGMDNHHDH